METPQLAKILSRTDLRLPDEIQKRIKELYQLGNKTPHICIQKKFMMSYRLNYFRSEIIFDEIG